MRVGVPGGGGSGVSEWNGMLATTDNQKHLSGEAVLQPIAEKTDTDRRDDSDEDYGAVASKSK